MDCVFLKKIVTRRNVREIVLKSVYVGLSFSWSVCNFFLVKIYFSFNLFLLISNQILNKITSTNTAAIHVVTDSAARTVSWTLVFAVSSIPSHSTRCWRKNQRKKKPKPYVIVNFDGMKKKTSNLCLLCHSRSFLT